MGYGTFTFLWWSLNGPRSSCKPLKSAVFYEKNKSRWNRWRRFRFAGPAWRQHLLSADGCAISWTPDGFFQRMKQTVRRQTNKHRRCLSQENLRLSSLRTSFAGQPASAKWCNSSYSNLMAIRRITDADKSAVAERPARCAALRASYTADS